MISVDTNLLLYSLNADCVEHVRARGFLSELGSSDDVVLCELVLVELYLLLRNPSVTGRPLAPAAAVEVCGAFRSHPRWRVVDAAPVMREVWSAAAAEGFARRRIIDARLAFTLRHHGVTELATRNVTDFCDFGFTRVWDPLA